MDFNTILKRLHARPRHERKAIAFSTAGSITALIALVWIVNLVSGLQTTGGQAASVADTITNSPAGQELGQGLQQVQSQQEKLFQQIQEHQAQLRATVEEPETQEITGSPDFNAYLQEIQDRKAFEAEVERIKQQRANRQAEPTDSNVYGSGSVYNVVE